MGVSRSPKEVVITGAAGGSTVSLGILECFRSLQTAFKELSKGFEIGRVMPMKPSLTNMFEASEVPAEAAIQSGFRSFRGLGKVPFGFLEVLTRFL